MSRRSSCLLALTLALAMAAVPGTAPAQAPIGKHERIAEGVSAGGVPVGGLSVWDAARRVDAEYRGHLERNVAVRAGGRTHRMSMERAKFEFDHVRTAKRALYAGRELAPGQKVDVPLALEHSEAEVREFALQVKRRVYRRPRDAKVRIGIRRVRLTEARAGRRIPDSTKLADKISTALADHDASRQIRARVRGIGVDVHTNEAKRRYRTVITVDRRSKKLRLFKYRKHRKTYGIAIGAAGFETPRGVFSITSKQVNPAWHAPNRPWAGQYAGKTVPGGAPNNPLKARWLGIVDGVGIHGTSEEWSIGTRASHGCIRMRVSDVKDLYRRVPMGTPVRIR